MFPLEQQIWKNYLQWHGRELSLVIVEPELCKEILNNRIELIRKYSPETCEEANRRCLAATVEAEKWAKLRKDCHPCLPWRELKNYDS
ncbi:hypothetical protein M0R45_020101 [Rubus argutus]|uniref:Uncharacterized protein n=1 Tax=Rubus argutus TaxID=59490 RepID=A0AAW1XAZ0_RUBAR